MGETYQEAEDGEWMDAQMRGHRIACCDCGLAHDYDFRVSESGRVQFRVRRNDRATSQLRRHMEPATVASLIVDFLKGRKR